MKYGASQLNTRREDERLITGRGCYIDDLVLPNMVHAVMIYSDHPHGRLAGIDAERARAAPGVLAVLTGADYAAEGLSGCKPRYLPQMFGYGTAVPIERPCLVTERVRHVGDRIAMVVAVSRAEALAAAEMVEVEISRLPHAVTLDDATADGAERIHAEREGNVAYELEMGDEAATNRAFETAESVHRVRLSHPRVTANSLEARASLGDYDAATGLYTLHTSTQNPHILRTEIAEMCLHIPESSLRVICHNVGGGFGMKTSTYPEDALVLWASRRLARPVKWVETRSEALRTDEQGRGNQGMAELALDGEGRILGLRTRIDHDVGAYMVGAGPMPPIHTARLTPGVYNVPAIHAKARAIYTNNPTIVPYRGAGRPEGIFLIEQLLDQAARDLGISQIEIRRRNFLRPEDLPHKTKVNFTYDSGEFETVMDDCIEFADWEGFEERKAADRAKGLLRGRGLGMYIHDTGALNDQADIRVDASGTVTVISGTTDTGQGHETTFAGQVAARLGVDASVVRVIQGDTDRVGYGRGSFASRSATMVGSAIEIACDAVIEKGKKLAGHLLEADLVDIEFEDATFRIKGTDRRLSLKEVAAASYRPGMPVSDRIGLSAGGAFAMTSPSFPNGCHICEVTVDPETGKTAVVSYTVVDDLGRMLNPKLCEGQVHGAVAQGVGESIMEAIQSDRASGQLLTGSFMDYAMPRAADLPTFRSTFRPVLCKTNPAGVKGAGEGGTVGSISTVRAAVLDALRELGVTGVEKPMTSYAVWKAIQEARSRT